MLSIDIAIPTFNRSAELDRTLDGLSRIAEPAGVSWKVVVVDNACTDATADVVARHEPAFRGRLVRLVEPQAGLCFARNCAVKHSQADAIAFLDDDVDVEPWWLSAIVEAFVAEQCAVVGGRAFLRYPGERPSWIGTSEEGDLSKVDLGDDRQGCASHQVFGLNMTIRREWFDRVGLFRTDLDRVGTCLLSGGDTELLDRISKAGGKIVYEPKAFLWHRVPESRLSRNWFLQRLYWGMRSGIRMKGYGRAEAVRRMCGGAITYAKSAASLAWRILRNGSDSDEAYERRRWLMSAQAEMHEAGWRLFWSRESRVSQAIIYS